TQIIVRKGDLLMAQRQTHSTSTIFGEIAYTDQGSGPAALFVHGAFFNGHFWSPLIDRVKDVRRCIAIDLLAHGSTKITPTQDVSLSAQAEMLEAFCHNLHLDKIDLVANDSGGAIAQIFASRHPERIRTLTLTNCDVHTECPPDALKPLLTAVESGALPAAGKKMLADSEFAKESFAVGYEHPERIEAATMKTYLTPLFSSQEAADNLTRFFKSIDRRDLVAAERGLSTLTAPTLIVWGKADIFFDVKWARWLRDTIPGCKRLIELDSAKLFFPEERPDELASALREHWQTVKEAAGTGSANC
ncbi:MAG TPA: alpha/beta hydrolase, partial [Blastocatellia bacterium]|nr:alpha/beta hydrolase [Blastocatellia bacterium]